MPGLPHPRIPSAPQEWTRRRLQLLLGIVAVAVGALAVGAVLSASAMLREEAGGPVAPAPPSEEISPGSSEEELARAPLPGATLEDAQPGPLSSQTTGTIVLPSAEDLGALDLPTGYPRTPPGALAQLIAIDRAAIEPAQVSRAQDVIEQWAAPGGPTPESWSGVSAVTTLLTSAEVPGIGTPDLQLRMDPAMGLIKGSVGEAFVVPCVDFVITADTGQNTVRVAVADCQRMVWTDGRWLIGPGPEPAPAPSLWPGTRASIEAGYQWLGAPPWSE